MAKDKTRDILRQKAQLAGLSGKQLQQIKDSAGDGRGTRAANAATERALSAAVSGINDELDRSDFAKLTDAVNQLLGQINQAVLDQDLRGASFATNSLCALMKQRDAIGARIMAREAARTSAEGSGDSWGEVLGRLEAQLNREAEIRQLQESIETVESPIERASLEGRLQELRGER